MKPSPLLCGVLAASIALGGCATSSADVAAAYVSPMQYHAYDCDQLIAETQRIQVRVSQAGGRLDEAAKGDKTATAVGMVLFWPALFFLGGSKAQEADFARLKGEYDAIQQAAINKRCAAMVNAAAKPPEPAAPKAAAGATTPPAKPAVR